MRLSETEPDCHVLKGEPSSAVWGRDLGRTHTTAIFWAWIAAGGAHFIEQDIRAATATAAASDERARAARSRKREDDENGVPAWHRQGHAVVVTMRRRY
jgi:hypothetical protein